jgi:phosphatidylserine synthase
MDHMKETQWVLRAIFLVGLAVSVALANVPGANEVDFNGLPGTVAGILLLGAMLFGAIRGERAAWLVVFGIVTLRTLWDLGVAIEEPGRALGWASAGSWVVVSLSAWGLRPANAFKRHSVSSDA